ncbi:hypothetical protein Tco_1118818 [Tanacetum coccineum]
MELFRSLNARIRGEPLSLATILPLSVLSQTIKTQLIPHPGCACGGCRGKSLSLSTILPLCALSQWNG